MYACVFENLFWACDQAVVVPSEVRKVGQVYAAVNVLDRDWLGEDDIDARAQDVRVAAFAFCVA